MKTFLYNFFATRKFKRMKAFARSKNEIRCMDLAYVDKLVKDNNGVIYLLVPQDLFDRTIDAKGMKTKGSKETVRAFLTMITKKWTEKIWVDKRTEFAGLFEKLCKGEVIQTYSTMSEADAAFTKRTTRSLKMKLYRYKENNEYKYIHNLPEMVLTLESGKKLFDRLHTRECKEIRLFAHSVQQTTTTIRKTQVWKWRKSSHLEV